MNRLLSAGLFGLCCLSLGDVWAVQRQTSSRRNSMGQAPAAPDSPSGSGGAGSTWKASSSGSASPTLSGSSFAPSAPPAYGVRLPNDVGLHRPADADEASLKPSDDGSDGLPAKERAPEELSRLQDGLSSTEERIAEVKTRQEEVSELAKQYREVLDPSAGDHLRIKNKGIAEFRALTLPSKPTTAQVAERTVGGLVRGYADTMEQKRIELDALSKKAFQAGGGGFGDKVQAAVSNPFKRRYRASEDLKKYAGQLSDSTAAQQKQVEDLRELLDRQAFLRETEEKLDGARDILKSEGLASSGNVETARFFLDPAKKRIDDLMTRKKDLESQIELARRTDEEVKKGITEKTIEHARMQQKVVGLRKKQAGIKSKIINRTITNLRRKFKLDRISAFLGTINRLVRGSSDQGIEHLQSRLAKDVAGLTLLNHEIDGLGKTQDGLLQGVDARLASLEGLQKELLEVDKQLINEDPVREILQKQANAHFKLQQRQEMLMDANAGLTGSIADAQENLAMQIDAMLKNIEKMDRKIADKQKKFDAAIKTYEDSSVLIARLDLKSPEAQQYAVDLASSLLSAGTGFRSMIDNLRSGQTSVAETVGQVAGIATRAVVKHAPEVATLGKKALVAGVRGVQGAARGVVTGYARGQASTVADGE